MQIAIREFLSKIIVRSERENVQSGENTLCLVQCRTSLGPRNVRFHSCLAYCWINVAASWVGSILTIAWRHLVYNHRSVAFYLFLSGWSFPPIFCDNQPFVVTRFERIYLWHTTGLGQNQGWKASLCVFCCQSYGFCPLFIWHSQLHPNKMLFWWVLQPNASTGQRSSSSAQPISKYFPRIRPLLFHKEINRRKIHLNLPNPLWVVQWEESDCRKNCQRKKRR